MFRWLYGLFFFFGVCVVGASSAWGGPWVAEPGHGYAKVGLRWLPGFGYWSGERKEGIPYGAYHEVFLHAYGEISVAPHLALTLGMPVVQQFFLEDTRQKSMQAHTTLGDPTFGLNLLLWKGSGFAVGLDFSVKAPLNRGGSMQAVYSTEQGFPKIADLRAGTGTWDVRGGFSVGYARERFYVVVGAGYLFRTLDFDHVLLWRAEGGYRFHPAWFVRLRVYGFHLLRNGTAPYQETLNGAGNGTEYGAFALEGEWTFRSGMVLGLGVEGGLWAVTRQTGGPVISLYWAVAW